MRSAIPFLLALLAAVPALAQGQRLDDVPPRYGIPFDNNNYPQATPKETLASVIKAMERRRINYVLAHLADPDYVEERVKKAGGDFELVVREATAKLNDKPDTIKELTRYLKEGEWEANENQASAQLKDLRDRKVFLRKSGARWFLENRQK